MEKSNSMSILFYMKKSKSTTKGYHLIMMRVTINGLRAEYSTKLTVKPTNWKNGKVLGGYSSVKAVNQSLDALYIRAQQEHSKLLTSKSTVSSQEVIDSLNGKSDSKRCLLEAFKLHNIEKSKEVDVVCTLATLKKYNTVYVHTKDFIMHRYKKDDILLTDINKRFAKDLTIYLMGTKKHSHNTVAKYIKCIKTVINFAIDKNWIINNPLNGHKCIINDVLRTRLLEDEVLKIRDTEIKNPLIGNIRDIFVFCCYTGLSFAEVFKLQYSNIEKRENGKLWISINRTKSGVLSEIPLLDQALSIMEKYKDNERAKKRGKVFPVISNKSTNDYLKTIGNLTNTKKHLTFHVARHTFATMMLNLGMSIEMVSRMLGHKSIRITQIYAKMLNSTVDKGMDMVQLKLKK